MAACEENYSDSEGSEYFYDILCDPCQEDGELNKAVGMCTYCQDYMCQKCFDVNENSRLTSKHKLLDKEAMLKSQRSHISRINDTCTEKCDVHEEEVIKYYCINHSHLGCSACITLDHRTCDNVRYIPHVAKHLAFNEEYQQVDNQLKSVIARSKKVSEDNKQKTESIKNDSSGAVEMVQDLRKQMNNALDKLENNHIQQCESLKSEETEKLASIAEQFQKSLAELNTLIATKYAYQNNKQSCNLYTLMMKIKDKLKLAEDGIENAEKKQSHVNSQIKFVANKENLNTLKLPEKLGKLFTSRTLSPVRPEQRKYHVKQKKETTSVKKVETKRIVKAEHIEDINVECKQDTLGCYVSGLAVLPGNRLVLTDNSNGTVKLVGVKHGQVITYLTLSSDPWDVAMVTNCQVAITMPDNNEIAIVKVTATVMVVDRTLDVDGKCHGVDYKCDKLAVSFIFPDKVQVLTLHGRVLYTMTTDQQGQDLFNWPFHVAFGRDNSSLYVSNYYRDNVVNVKFDGTVVGTYTDSRLRRPRGLLTDSSGHVYVCGWSSDNIHQINSDCWKVRVLLTEVGRPLCISYCETDCRLYVGKYDNGGVKMYRVIHDFK